MKYLIDFKHSTTQQEIDNYFETYGYSILQVWNNFDKIFLIETHTDPIKTEIVEDVVINEASVIKPLTLGEVEIHPKMWCLKDPSLPQIDIRVTDEKDWWKNYSLIEPEFDKDIVSIARKGSKIPVYIMDSGIKADHPEFEGVQIENLFSIIPGNFEDTNGHGTAIASVISGKTCGLTSSPIKVVKIFSSGHETLQSELLSALDAIITDVPENTFAVVNCSWVIPRNPWIERKMLGMIQQGIYIIAAAGNNGGSIEDVTPAAMPEVITIGSYNSELKPSDFSAYTGESHISYTNSHVNGGQLDGWAPGEKIWSANLLGGYGNASGTSMAAAIASAVLAYNLNDITNSNGKRLVGFEDWILVGDPNFDKNQLFWLCLRRENLLDLSDIKYEESKNSIVTLADAEGIDHFNSRGTTEEAFVIRVDEKKFGPRLFYSHEVSKVEILEPMPENFSINQMGSMVGKPSLSQGPDAGEFYKIYKTKIKITYIDSMVVEKSIDIYVLGSATDIGELPEDHPIRLRLQSVCNGFPQFCQIAGFPQGCFNSCFTPGGCCDNQSKDASCICY